jgi:hypothetical protein
MRRINAGMGGKKQILKLNFAVENRVCVVLGREVNICEALLQSSFVA